MNGYKIPYFEFSLFSFSKNFEANLINLAKQNFQGLESISLI